MIDKRFFSIYCIIFSFLASIMTILIVLLFFEYRFFCHQANELIVLKRQYCEYVDLLQKRIDGDDSPQETSMPSFEVPEELVNESLTTMAELSAAEASDDPDDDDEYVDESFVVINRQPEYLKQSTLEYIESQDLHPLMTTIDMDRWSDYTDQVVKIEPEKKQSVGKPVVREKPKAKMSAVRRAHKDFGFMWPIDADKFWLSSLFGPRKRINGTWGFHHGIDMAAVKGTIVKAARAGTVVEASFQTGYGNTVVIQHNERVKTRYAHLHTIRAYVGQKIKQGAVVGTVGETGFIRKKGKDGSHLHFEVYEWGKRTNPLHCLPRTA